MPKSIPENLLVKTITETFIDEADKTGLIRSLVLAEGRAAQEKIRFALEATLSMTTFCITESVIKAAVEEIYKHLTQDQNKA